MAERGGPAMQEFIITESRIKALETKLEMIKSLDLYWKFFGTEENVVSVEHLQNRGAHAPGIDFVTDSEWYKAVADVSKGTITLDSWRAFVAKIADMDYH